LAIVLPVLFMIGFGIFEFGYLIYNLHLITTGVRDAARYASGLPQGSADAAAKNLAMTGVTSGGTDRVSWWNDPTTITITYPTVANTVVGGLKSYRGGDNIVLVQVAANVDYQGLGFLGFLGLGSITLHAQHEERLYGVR
jgi:Flp pilus assembly protein TadG